MKLYHSASSPNSRRVRILLAEKGLAPELVAIDLGKGEQHSEAYRAIAGPHDYAQIPQLVERGALRVRNLLGDVELRLRDAPFVAGERFSVADITLLVTIDFAAKAMDLHLSDEFPALLHWHDTVSKRPSAWA